MDFEFLFWYIIDGLVNFEIDMIFFVAKSLFDIGFILGISKLAFNNLFIKA